MSLSSSLRLTIGALAATVAMHAVAAAPVLDVAKSSVTATFKQEGVPVESPFRKFSGSISYDPANVAAATALIEVETASLDIGDAAYNAEVRKPAWFDTAHYPKASFRSTSIKPNGTNGFTATGALTVKGRVLTITVPVTVKTAGNVTTFDGTYNFSRKAFGVGDPVWNDVLEDQVVVRFRLVNAVR